MFDTLTREQLSTLHELLYIIGQAIFGKLFDGDYAPRIPTDSDEWRHLRAEQLGNSAQMEQVYAEMRRRDNGGAPANADGADHEHPMPTMPEDYLRAGHADA